MRRRSLLSAAIGGGAAALAGCTLSADELLVDETVEEATIFQFELSAGETVEITLETDGESVAYAEFVDPNGAVLQWLEAEPTATVTETVERRGDYELWIYPEATVDVRAIIRV